MAAKPRQMAATLAVVLGLAAASASSATPLPASADALASAMRGHRIVVLGEVHDNGAQHALRLQALRSLIDGGARPALAFEQFDRERQADIDRARREHPGDADYVIAQARGAASWRWEFYRPFVALALQYDLPIIAANLSRADAMKIAETEAQSAPEALRSLPESFLRAHEASIALGHCNLLPATALPGMARAQIARDRALAEAIRPYASRGAVLLTGNGHGRIDIGVPYWLTTSERSTSVSIALLERGDETGVAEASGRFHAYVLTERAERPDPCEDMRKRMRPPATP